MIIVNYLFRRSWSKFWFVSLTSTVSGLCGAGLARLIGEGIIKSGNFSSNAILFFAMCTGLVGARICAERTVMKLSQQTISEMRIGLSRKLLRTPLETLRSIGRDDLLIIFTRDIPTFLSFSQRLPQIFCNVVLILACFVYLAYLSVTMLLMMIVFLVIFTLTFKAAERRPRVYSSLLREQVTQQYKNFASLIDGSRELKLNSGRGKAFVDKIIATETSKAEKTAIDMGIGYSWVNSSVVLMFYGFIGFILFVVPTLFSYSSGLLGTFVVILVFLMRPVNELTSSVAMFRQAEIALNKVRQLDHALSAEEAPYLTTGSFSSAGPLHVEFRDVVHRYRGAKDSMFVLGALNLEIRQGEIVFIVGGNGSGKTTLAMLLLGLYEPDSGHVLLNGVPVTTSNIEEYRQHFSAIFAEFFLFEYLLDDLDALEERARGYIEKFGLANKVKVTDGKFSTIDLSTGQRKRLALVLSYLEDRPIYLFDEWAADQDPVFKRVFYTELLPDLKARGKTVIAITHDDSYFHCADRLIKLEDGHLQSLQVGVQGAASADAQLAASSMPVSVTYQ